MGGRYVVSGAATFCCDDGGEVVVVEAMVAFVGFSSGGESREEMRVQERLLSGVQRGYAQFGIAIVQPQLPSLCSAGGLILEYQPTGPNDDRQAKGRDCRNSDGRSNPGWEGYTTLGDSLRGSTAGAGDSRVRW